jgi:hypothetical protein
MIEAQQAQEIIRRTLLASERFRRPAGLSSIPADDPAYGLVERDPRGGVHPALNLLLGEALVRYGCRKEAADLLESLLRASLDSLRRDHSLRQAYHPDSGEGLGRRNDILGLPPLSLFLDILGIGLRSPSQVVLSGTSPLPGPVVVRWRGLQIERTDTGARVTFPDGGVASWVGGEPSMVEEVGTPEAQGNGTKEPIRA